MEILALLGLIAVLFVGMKWGPLFFNPLLDFLGQILKFLSQMPRTIFVILLHFILWNLNLVATSPIGVLSHGFKVLSWEFISVALITIAFVLAFLWDIRTATFPRLKVRIFGKKQFHKPISD